MMVVVVDPVMEWRVWPVPCATSTSDRFGDEPCVGLDTGTGEMNSVLAEILGVVGCRGIQSIRKALGQSSTPAARLSLTLSSHLRGTLVLTK